MHPGFFGWWARRHHTPHDGPEAWAHCGPHGHHGHHGHGRDREGFFAHGGDDGGGLGVRRPLRFLAHKLELEDPQVEKLAAILSALKTERAQAAVEQRRRLAAIAEAVEAQVLDPAKLAEVTAEQQKSEARLAAAVERALGELHALLDDEQRKKLAYLLRTGILTI